MTTRRIQFAVSAVSLAAVVWWAVHQPAPDLPESPTAVGYLLLALAIYAVATLLRGERWHRILHRNAIALERTDSYALTVVGYMGNNTLPARGGDLLRVFLVPARVAASRRSVLDWRRTNMTAQKGLVRRLRECLRAAGFPIVLARLFDRKTPSHQCGTIRIGADPAKAPLDPFGRAFDHPNLFVTDASTLVTSAAVNPALTIAALALRTADHIRSKELKSKELAA